MSAASPLANVDWPTIAAAIGTLIATIWLSIKGIEKGKKKTESGQSSITSIVGASLIENATIQAHTEQLRINSQTVHEMNQCLHSMCEELRRNTAAITRQTDLDLIQNRKTDYRDTRDNP